MTKNTNILIVNSSINTVVISRDLFERLCEAAIELRGNTYWKKTESRYGYADDYAALSLTCDEAVAIRDRGKKD